MKRLFRKYFCFASLFLNTALGGVMAQTYSAEEVEIRGIQFSRFVVSLKASPQWESDPHSASWKTAIETNLCWSNAFQVKGSQRAGCGGAFWGRLPSAF